MKSVVAAAALTVVLLIVALAYVHFNAGRHISESPAHAAAAPPPDARTPDADFLRDYDRFVSLSADVTKRVAEGSPSIEQEQDEARGIVQRLTAAVPHGFIFDDKSRSFVPAGPMPAPPPPALPKK